ncbi:MAG: adenylate/guanylate cyclase domain-containing protein, partial [Actinocatenispora sp.]
MEVHHVPVRSEPIDETTHGDHGLPSGVVTFLFTDIEGSTRLARALGPLYREVLADHRRLLRDCLRSERGAELLTEGDSFFAVFADADAALRACVRAQRALAAHRWPSLDARPRVRMGLHTGYAEARRGEYASAEVHRAARVAAAAAGDQVLCSAATALAARQYLRTGEVRLLDLGTHRLRGFDDRTGIHQVTAGGLRRDFPPPRTVDGRTGNLPASPGRFVGRDPERMELAMLAREHRLVTVWGAGGVGKTRLAVEVARDVAGSYPTGAWFCDLAGAQHEDRVEQLLAESLGVCAGCGQSATDAVTEHLAGSESLLVVDSGERQRPAVAALVAHLLASCPGITVLATSRQPLGVPGELVWHLGPLRADGADSDAVSLLADRAAGAGLRPGGVPSRPADLERLARYLGGLPLAMELAAPWLRTLPAGLLLERLAASDGAPLVDPLGRPTPRHDAGPLPSRHACLGASLDWSCRLLRPDAERLLRRLAGWPGRVDLAAVEWLTAGWLDQAQTCAALAELVDASLLEPELTDITAGYRMLEPVRWAVRRRSEDPPDALGTGAGYQPRHGPADG